MIERLLAVLVVYFVLKYIAKKLEKNDEKVATLMSPGNGIMKSSLYCLIFFSESKDNRKCCYIDL